MVWHGVPREMVGDTVFPLLQLHEIDPKLYESQEASAYGWKTNSPAPRLSSGSPPLPSTATYAPDGAVTDSERNGHHRSAG